jgi:hypothetical protein
MASRRGLRLPARTRDDAGRRLRRRLLLPVQVSILGVPSPAVTPTNLLYNWSPALRADGVIVPGETCLDSVENGETCSVGAPPEGGKPAVITGLSAHELSLGVVCQAPAEDECVTGATQYAVWATMYGATVTLSDPTPPTLGTPSGALWGPGEAGGFHKGTESVTVSADDVGGGVASIVLSADGRPVRPTRHRATSPSLRRARRLQAHRP